MVGKEVPLCFTLVMFGCLCFYAVKNVIIWIFLNVFIQVIGNRREGTNWDESRKHALNTRTAFVLSYPDFQHVRCVMAEASWGVQNVFSSLLPLKQSECISPW